MADSRLENYWQDLVSGQRRGLVAAGARGLLWVLSGPYQVGLEANLALYDTGLKQRSHPLLPVISVGNLSLGGTGKSTAVRYLVRRLQALGTTPGIVLRGHRRRRGPIHVLAADGAGQVAPVQVTGDEAAEAAACLPGVPIAVGKRREQAIALLAHAGAEIAVLDDGFQYFRMVRDLDFVLIDAELSPAATRLFPRGVLREPWRHLRRASMVWLTHADQVCAETVAGWRTAVAAAAPGLPLALAEHDPQVLLEFGSGATHAPSVVAGRRVLALSGLGSPASFERCLRDLGAQLTSLRFPDHHWYATEDLAQVRAAAVAAGAEMIVTSEKDAVKLRPVALKDQLWRSLPVFILRSELRLLEGEGTVDRLLEGMARQAGKPADGAHEKS